MAAENHERAERARKKHEEVRGYGVADLATLSARLDAWPMDGAIRAMKRTGGRLWLNGESSRRSCGALT